jgi:uncharacterized C2H2 Zn-finger protein
MLETIPIPQENEILVKCPKCHKMEIETKMSDDPLESTLLIFLCYKCGRLEKTIKDRCQFYDKSGYLLKY